LNRRSILFYWKNFSNCF